MITSTCDADAKASRMACNSKGSGQVLVPSGTTRQTRWFSRPAPATARASDELSDLLRLKDLARPTENRSIGLRGHPLSRRHGVTVPLGYSAAQVHLTAN